LTATDINDFYDERYKIVKAATVEKQHANIHSALKFAVKKNFIQHSVMDNVDRPDSVKFSAKFLRQSEAIALFEAIRGHRLETAVILGAFYGLRRSEVVGLRWSAIDFEANTISIEHTVTIAQVEGKTVVVAEDTTKSKSSLRTLPLVPQFRAKLLELKEEQEQFRKLCGNAYDKAEGKYICVNQLGKRIKPDYITNEFPKFMEEHGFRRLRFHDLRHSCASLLLANGVSLKQIQEWLGHSTFAITADTYAHLEFQSKQQAAQAMSWIEKTQLGLTSGVIETSLPEYAETQQGAIL
jgi:integrase